MTIPGPYLLYLGDAQDELSIKTSRGLAVWRPQSCIGQYRRAEATVTLDLPDLSFQAAAARGAKTLVVGLANAGGVLSQTAARDVVAAIEAGLNVASGLHQRLASRDDIRLAAQERGVALYDVREAGPPPPVGDGRPRPGRRLLTVGTDCSVGKMYATLALEKALRARGIAADFRATGQTGILIAGAGAPVDAVVADFISGAIEQLSPARHDDGWDLIEGQGSLFHPSYAGVSLGLLHGAQPDALVLCHDVGREHMRGLPGRPLPDLATCLAANLEAARLTNSNVQAVGVAVNTSRLDAAAARRWCDRVSDEMNLPCTDPIAMGADPIVDRMLQCFAPSPSRASAGR